jgi:hypothetical protein
MNPTLNGVDKRLRKRYETLVAEHTGQAQTPSGGPRTLPSKAQAQAHSQATWRFFNNHSLSLPQLLQPLLDLASDQVESGCDHYGLLVHDWSGLDYTGHSTKKGRIHPAGEHSGLGYELACALLLADRDGLPSAPLRLRLRAADGVYDTAHRRRRAEQDHLDGLLEVVREVRERGLVRPLVHIIDAEGDSVYHLRHWHAAGHLFLVRTDDQRVVRHRGEEVKMPRLLRRLRRQGCFGRAREVLYKGRKAQPYVACADVVLARPAWRQRWAGGRPWRVVVPGAPLPVRLVVSEVRDGKGRVLARWQLMTNAPPAVPAATVALWYYWRWQIESYFKLLKSAGQQLEHWQQDEHEAITRRLLVASMACALVWRLARSTAPEAPAARQLLQRLSGRQATWGREFTEEALLAGFWVLLAMLQVLRERSPADLKGIADFILAGSG